MECSKCGGKNRAEANFCKWCGTQLVSEQDIAAAKIMPDVIGLTTFKDVVRNIVETHRAQTMRGIKRIRDNDMIITGNAGTGKTFAVKKMTKVLHDNGILKNPVPVILNATTTLTSYLNEVDQHLDELKGSLLCVDAFQGVAHEARQGGALSVMDRLFEVKNMIKDEGELLMIVICGIDNGDITTYLRNNRNIAGNFRFMVQFPDFSLDEMVEMCSKILGDTYTMTLSDEARGKVKRVLKQKLLDNDEKIKTNGKFLQKFVDDIFDAAQKRDDSDSCIQPEDVRGKEYIQKTYEEAVAELDKYVGIDEIRSEIKSIGDSIQSARDEGEDYSLANHYLFLGNPGTGKTTIARTLSNVLTALEALPVGHIVEVDRSQLVSKYVGETPQMVTKAVDKAMGGILFIDEAYTLIKDSNDSYGREAVDTLLKLMEDRRGKIIVIAAGYANEMRRFIDSNPGLKSRFNKTINFRDYKPDELKEIFMRMLSSGRRQYTLEPSCEEHLLPYFMSIYNQRGKDFANARTVRNVFEQAVERHNSRIERLKAEGNDVTDEKNVLTREDVEGDSMMNVTADEAMEALDELIGMESVKKAIHDLKANLEIERERIERGLMDPKNSLQHIVLTGNPGTGKTTVAKMLGSIFHAIGLLPTDKVVEKEAKNLKSSYQNETAKLMNDAVDEAMGGILFIDEAYMLMTIDGSGQVDKTGAEAVGALITRMLNDAGKFVLVMAGYPREMEEFIDKANPGFRRRFRAILHIDDYTADELYRIFMLKAKKLKWNMSPEAEHTLKLKIDQMVNTKGDTFGNAGEMDKLLAAVTDRQAKRLSEAHLNGEELTDDKLMEIVEDDIPYEKPQELDPNKILAKLDNFVGLNSVKNEIRTIVNTLNVYKQMAEVLGKTVDLKLDHYVFMGNPGTGKTTIAQMMADVFHSMGLLPSNKLIAVERKDLVAGYLGQTAPKVNRAVQSALGGVLFIDEAYALVQGENDTFGLEALNTLLPLLLTYKNKFICIVAGYTDCMEDWLHNNPGLTSRFTKRINFEDYTPEELTQIFKLKVNGEGLNMNEEAEEAVFDYFDILYSRRDAHFGNARTAGNFFEKVKATHSNRMVTLDFNSPDFNKSVLLEITKDDVKNSIV